MSHDMSLPLLLLLTLNMNVFFSFSHLYFSSEVWQINDLNHSACFELLASQPELYVQILVFLHLRLHSLYSGLNTSTIFHLNVCVCVCAQTFQDTSLPEVLYDNAVSN